jgi:trypsin
MKIFNFQANYPLEGFPNVSPIPLPPLCASECCGSCAQGNDVTIAGWGRIDNGTLPETLFQVSKGIMSQSQCSPFWWNLTPRMFCTIVENGIDSCNGDSGTAVVRDGIQVGIVSFGSSVCGDGSRPAVYVRIEDPSIRNFINQQTGL